MSQRRTLTVIEAGEILGISRSHAYEAVRTGEIPSIRIGKRWIVPADEIDKLLANAGKRSDDRPEVTAG